MAVLNYISAISTTTPISPYYSTPSVKVLLPKKQPMKWSTRVASGEYGGPPITIKLRKYWGGEKEDPLTSDEFIWNNDFMGRMKKLIEDTDESSLLLKTFLFRLEVDLSKELTVPSKAVLEKPFETAIQQATGNMSAKWRFVPTRREQEKWDKARCNVPGIEATSRGPSNIGCSVKRAVLSVKEEVANPHTWYRWCWFSLSLCFLFS